MEMITVTLHPYNDYEAKINKTSLIELFPQSVFSVALRDHPEVTSITVNDPELTPYVLFVLQGILDTGKSPPSYISHNHKSEFIQAADYLNIDYLRVVGDPHYYLLRERYFLFDPLDPNVLANPIAYRHLMDYADRVNSPGIKEYLVNHSPLARVQ